MSTNTTWPGYKSNIFCAFCEAKKERCIPSIIEQVVYNGYTNSRSELFRNKPCKKQNKNKKSNQIGESHWQFKRL